MRSEAVELAIVELQKQLFFHRFGRAAQAEAESETNPFECARCSGFQKTLRDTLRELISPIPADRSPDKFWEIRAFNTTNPELSYRYGNTGRNLLTTPGLKQWDFSLTKQTQIREGHTLEFRFESFNFPNHPNFNSPAVDARQPATFGRITSARTMRELQFGFKYIF